MNFKYYDTLNFLVTGALTLALMNYFDLSELVWYGNEVSTFAFLIYSYAAGAVVNAVGSMVGRKINSWCGWPSALILDEKKGSCISPSNIGRCECFERDAIKQRLGQELGNGQAGNQQLFWYAKRIAEAQSSSRINDFNAQYAFFRSLLTLVLGTLALMLAKEYLFHHPYFPWHEYLLVLVAVVLCFWRMRGLGFYYAREVLDVYWRTVNKTERNDIVGNSDTTTEPELNQASTEHAETIKNEDGVEEQKDKKTEEIQQPALEMNESDRQIALKWDEDQRNRYRKLWRRTLFTLIVVTLSFFQIFFDKSPLIKLSGGVEMYPLVLVLIAYFIFNSLLWALLSLCRLYDKAACVIAVLAFYISFAFMLVNFPGVEPVLKFVFGAFAVLMPVGIQLTIDRLQNKKMYWDAYFKELCKYNRLPKLIKDSYLGVLSSLLFEDIRKQLLEHCDKTKTINTLDRQASALNMARGSLYACWLLCFAFFVVLIWHKHLAEVREHLISPLQCLVVNSEFCVQHSSKAGEKGNATPKSDTQKEPPLSLFLSAPELERSFNLTAPQNHRMQATLHSSVSCLQLRVNPPAMHALPHTDCLLIKSWGMASNKYRDSSKSA